jgi:hypothetical protein
MDIRRLGLNLDCRMRVHGADSIASNFFGRATEMFEKGRNLGLPRRDLNRVLVFFGPCSGDTRASR